MKCFLCGNEHYNVIHNGVRDNPNIKVLKCANCGLVQLSKFPENEIALYESGEMLHNEYDVISDCYHDIDFDRWKEITLPDDERRYNMLKDICAGKHVLEFGCGNGGFLRRIKDVAKSVAAVELDEFAIAEIRKEGIQIEKSIELLSPPCGGTGKWDVIVSFMVIEHLVNPIDYLKKSGNFWMTMEYSYVQQLMRMMHCCRITLARNLLILLTGVSTYICTMKQP